MAAGLGFKDFTTGEVLTAADVDGYLMQGVWVFASAAARDAAVTSPQEGNFAYLKDTNVTTYYTGSAWANLDTTGMTNPMTTTGDTIYSSSGSTPARLGIGTTGQVLTVAAGVPSWATPAGGGSGPAFSAYRSTNQSFSNSTWSKISFNSETFDTDADFASGTFTPSKAGYYQLNASMRINSGSETFGAFYKNGNAYSSIFGYGIGTIKNSGAVLVYANGTTDYFEVYGYSTGGSPVFAGDLDGIDTNFNGVWIRD